MGVAEAGRAGGGHVHGVVAEIGQAQIAQQDAAVGVGIGAHAARAGGGQFGQFRFEAALVVEEFFGPVAFQPVLKLLQMFGRVRGGVGERHLVGAEGAFDLAGHPPTFGPVQPLGELRTIIGQRGRVVLRSRRASRWIL